MQWVSRRRWIGCGVLSLVGATLLLDAGYALSKVEPPPTAMELCLAGEAQQRLCLDPLWRRHWHPYGDLPFFLHVPSQGEHDEDCRREVMVASCGESISRFPEMWDNNVYRTGRVPPAIRLEAECGIVVLAGGLLLTVRRRVPRHVRQ